MSYKNFDRHEAFAPNNHKMMRTHSATIELTRAFNMNEKGCLMNDVMNMLYGIWDGFLYDALIPTMKAKGYPKLLIQRVQETVDFIEADIKKNGERRTAI